MNSTEQAVVGWGSAQAAWANAESVSVSRALCDALLALGVTDAFGILGGGIAPFAAGMALTPMRFRSFRHEAGAGFAAIEAFHATGRPTMCVVTTGPGLANVINAAIAARVDGAKVLFISGATSRAQRGRGAVQETHDAVLSSDWYRPGPLFHHAALPETVDEVAHFVARLQVGFARPGGFVAHLALPWALQAELVQRSLTPPTWTLPSAPPSPAAIDACLEALRDESAVLWLGHGASSASTTLVQFAERASLPMICSPRGKGVVPETHRQLVGVSGAGGSAAVKAFVAATQPRRAVVVGSRLGEVTSFLTPSLMPSAGIVHVDIDDDAFGAAFPGTGGIGIVAESAPFADALLARAEQTDFFAARSYGRERVLRAIDAARATVGPDDVIDTGDDVDPRVLMRAIQKQIVDGTDAVVMSEAGTSFTWCNAHLRFSTPGRYRTSAAWGSMGHFTSGAVGAALAGERRVVAVVGDGAMLMNNEINTAVQYKARVVWIVLNDAQLGLNEHGMRALGMAPVETQMPRVDFVGFARSQGADGCAVNTPAELERGLAAAMAATGPFVVDVRIARAVPSPVVADRIKSLRTQGAR
jgi:acetolactate synthase-1/2/3 large subunit